jgi:hypothetical protein
MDIKTLQDTPPWDWPEDAATTFQKILTGRGANASDRLIAADLAGDLVVMNDDLAEALMAIVSSSDEPEKLRAQAAISLGPVLEDADTNEFLEPDELNITEDTFHKIQDLLKLLYADESVPKLVRRRILEASVRAPQPWHTDAIRVAYSSRDKEWMLTAVFAMRYVRGLDDLILDALENPDPDIHYEAVIAAGNWELEGAWPHVSKLLDDPRTPKPLLLAAIEAVGTIRPLEARSILADFADSDDEDIEDAAHEAIAMAEGLTGDDEDDDEWEDDEEED